MGTIDVGYYTDIKECRGKDIGLQTTLRGVETLDVVHQVMWKDLRTLDDGYQITIIECGAKDEGNQLTTKEIGSLDIIKKIRQQYIEERVGHSYF